MHLGTVGADRQDVKPWRRALICALSMVVLFAATARRSEMSGLPADAASLAVLAPSSTAEVLRLARLGEFARLTRRFDAARGRLERDSQAEFELAQLVSAFRVVDARLDAPLDRWVADAPTSYAARLARAAHRLARLEWQRQNRADSGDDSGPTDHAAAVAAVLDDTHAALAIDRRLAPAYAQAIDAHALATPAEPHLCRDVAARAIDEAPASAGIREAFVHCLLALPAGPLRDGEIEAWTARPPAMPGLTALVAWDHGRRATGGSAIAS